LARIAGGDPAGVVLDQTSEADAAAQWCHGHEHRRILKREIVTMPTSPELLFVIADGEHARFVRPAADNALHSETAFDSVTAHLRASDLGSDHPGASFHSGSTGHHSIAPRHDLHAMEKENFAHEVARQLNAASDTFDEMVVVAPSHVLSAIKDALNTTTAAKVIGTLSKDLAKTPDSELWTHLRAWVRPAHRLMR
jgi:protein required for attachment to host cells